MAKTTPQPKGTRVKAEMWDNPPETLDKHPFYGLKLDNEQKAFRDAIWNPKNQITFVNAGAGSGKTLISVATANLMVRYGLFDEIIYITSPCHERKQGFLSGSLFEKSLQYFYPLYDALTSVGIQPDKVVHSDDENVEKFGSPYIRPMTDSFIRGRNFGTRESRVIV